MATEGPPNVTGELAIISSPGTDGFVRMRIYEVVNNTLGVCVQSVMLDPESARIVALNLTKASIECEEQ